MNVNMKTLNKTWNSIDNTWKMVGLTVIAAGALFYPAMLFYNYMMQKRQKAMTDEHENEHTTKAFSPTYRSHMKPHRRKLAEAANGTTE